jgi:predicted nucleotide-binding protein (sugar kinase/HSP70/actin superfamily)
MPTTCGPCRFGQYSHFIRQVLQRLGYGRVPILSPSSSDGYDGMNLDRNGLLRAGWRSMVTSEILHRMLLHIRPYERKPGETDAVYTRCMEDLCNVLRRPGLNAGLQMEMLAASLKRSGDLLRSIPIVKKDLPVIGIVGEIFCRLNEFSNQDMVRRLESYGVECWLSGISEWLAYANMEQLTGLYRDGKRFSLAMAKAKLKHWIQHRDERALLKPFLDDLPEEAGIGDLIDKGRPYLPNEGVIGEMVLSVGKSVYLWERGASGIIDISPFSCMNGVVSQAVYPRVSDEHDRIPIRVFFFDQSQKDLDQDISIFMELVHTYRAQKRKAG